MDNVRVFLMMGLGLLGLLLWQAWQKDYAPQPPIVETRTAEIQQETAPADDLPVMAAAEQGDISVERPSSQNMAIPTDQIKGQRIHVVTDVYDLEIDTLGGVITHIALTDYPADADRPEIPFVLLEKTAKQLYVAENGLVTSQGPAASHHQLFTSKQTKYRLADDQADQLVVPLYWQNEQGLQVIKTYTFTRGSYEVGVSFAVDNQTGADLKLSVYSQLKRQAREDKEKAAFLRTFIGGAVYDGEKYEKLNFDEFEEEAINKSVKGGWSAMVQHYFVGVVVPDQTATNQIYTKVLANQRYVVGATAPARTLAAGNQEIYQTSLFLGPKLQDKLADIAPALGRTVDYGWLTIVAEPLFWIMNIIYKVVGNWGIAIILVTLIIKAVFFKLSESQYRSMAKMRVFAPRIKTLKERYGDDRMKLNQAMMDLYKKEKFNPLGGCLPLLVQFPVFIALYWVLLESVELRQAPFGLWLQDLSQPDPLFILPVLYGLAMFAQQKLSSSTATMDPLQAKIMNMMPIGLTVFFTFFPSGLVLYWVVNTVLGIAQQWVITKRVEQES